VHEYELMYILHPRLTADETTAAVERVSESVRSGGGEVLAVDVWGRRRLAYPIQHHLEGTYVLLTMQFPPEATARLEAGLRISEDVIRHLLVRGIIPYEGPSMQEERGRSQRPTPSEAEAEDGGDEGEAPAADADDTGSENDGSEPEPQAEGAG
jgi:small subunit ribosomal protein S6